MLNPSDPELRLELQMTDQFGHMRATVYISPDGHSRHEMTYSVDLSYLRSIMDGCSAIRAAWTAAFASAFTAPEMDRK